MQTGSGSLGQNAGSITGGTGLSGLLSGHGISTPVTVPVPQTDPTDPPQTDPTDPPQTDPADPPQTDPTDPSQTDPVTPPQEETDDPAVTAPADTGEKGTEDTVTVRVEENRIENVFSLIVETSEGTQLRTLETKIAVTMKYSMPAAQRGKKLYVVFRNADGTYEAIKAEYDPEAGELKFETDRTGKFVIVGLDFDGTEFSPAFYKALALLDEIKNLK